MTREKETVGKEVKAETRGTGTDNETKGRKRKKYRQCYIVHQGHGGQRTVRDMGEGNSR